MGKEWIISPNEPILITGSCGFIGIKVVETLIEYGFRNLRCFVRPSSNVAKLNKIIASSDQTTIDIVQGNLIAREDCLKATKDVALVFHLAAESSKSFAGVFMSTVIPTRNLLDAILQNGNLKRFLNVSSFAVYSNRNTRRGGMLDETCQIDKEPEKRFDAYAYGKAKQDELLLDYNSRYNTPYVIVRPGAVYGPGKVVISGRVGIDSFGIFLHMGGRNRIPFTYVDNCAEAIVLAGITKGVDGEVFNIVDDNLPTSRRFLKMYKRNVRSFFSLSVPYSIAFALSYLWEKYADWSHGQLPPAFNRRRCINDWRGNRYSNEKLKRLLGWKQRVGFQEATRRYFEYQKVFRRRT
jgi:nucleoside-diphosphate-sugar epimerase